MTDVQVHVSGKSGDALAGLLFTHRRRGSESATFAYAGDYLATSGAYALDPAVPLGSGTRQTRASVKLFGAFSDCAPDSWGRSLVTRREAALARQEGRSPRTLGEIDFLLGVRDDLRQGNLRFRNREGGPFLSEENAGVPALTDIPELLSLAARAEDDTADLPDLQRLVRVGSSLGGARPKVHVIDARGRVAIAKFPSQRYDTWNVMAWEKVMLDLARRAGIEVPAAQLLDLAGRHVILVERFDRTAGGQRIGYASAMTMLEADDGSRGSYLEIGEVIETTSARATEELHQLWRRIVFSVLVRNTDDHLRNHGFLHERGDVWRLSPAFDLNPNPEPGPTYLSTSIDGTDDPSTIDAALAVADAFRLAKNQAEGVMREVADAVASWRDVATSNGLTTSDLVAMEPAFTALADVRRS